MERNDPHSFFLQDSLTGAVGNVGHSHPAHPQREAGQHPAGLYQAREDAEAVLFAQTFDSAHPGLPDQGLGELGLP